MNEYPGVGYAFDPPDARPAPGVQCTRCRATEFQRYGEDRWRCSACKKPVLLIETKKPAEAPRVTYEQWVVVPRGNVFPVSLGAEYRFRSLDAAVTHRRTLLHAPGGPGHYKVVKLTITETPEPETKT